MGISISRDKHGLEKQQARGPHAGSAAEPGQNIFADKRLDLEQQECSAENRQRVRWHRVTVERGKEGDEIYLARSILNERCGLVFFSTGFPPNERQQQSGDDSHRSPSDQPNGMVGGIAGKKARHV